MTDNKPVVFATVTYPHHLTHFFADVEERGYEVRHFPIGDQRGMLQAAFEESAKGNPVALICSQVMGNGDPFGGFMGNYRGETNGDGLAAKLQKGCEGPTLTMVYSSMVSDRLDIPDENAQHQMIEVSKGMWASRDKSDSEVVCDAMDKFFTTFKPA